VKQTNRKHKLVWTVLVAMALTLTIGVPTLADLIFGMGEYPGGTLRAVYLMQGEEGEPPITYTVQVTPNGDLYDMTETISSPSLAADEVGSGLGPGGAAGTAGVQYDDDEDENIDTSPLNALDDRNVDVQPNDNYYLPDGARLVSGEVVEYAGIQAVMCTYIHPNYPSQVVYIALTDNVTSGLLLFPVYLRVEENGVETRSIELVEFDYKP